MSAKMSVSDLCYELILAAERDGVKKYFLLATSLHARIRELEGQLRDEIATNAARLSEDPADESMLKFCKRLVRENEDLRGQLHAEIDANTAFREAGGARDDEDMPTFCARLIRERNELGAMAGDIQNGVPPPKPALISVTTEFAWLVERTGASYLFVSDAGALDWTCDHMRALRFTRRIDADAMAGLFEHDDCEAVDHAWHTEQSTNPPEQPA